MGKVAEITVTTPAGTTTHKLINDDFTNARRYVEDGSVQLHLFSNPYPGVGDAPYSEHYDYVEWMWARRDAVMASLSYNGVMVQNIFYPTRERERRRYPNGDKFADHGNSIWLNEEMLCWPHLWHIWSEEWDRYCAFRLHNIYIWDKLNPPPTGYLKRRPIDGYEFCFALARPGFQYRHKRQPYAEKTKGKAKTGNMRKPDIRGNMGGNNTDLHSEGAIPTNIIRASPTGGSEAERARAVQGSFPESLAEFFIYSYALPGDTVCDITCGTGTTNVVAAKLGMNSVGFDINPDALEGALNALRELNENE